MVLVLFLFPRNFPLSYSYFLLPTPSPSNIYKSLGLSLFLLVFDFPSPKLHSLPLYHFFFSLSQDLIFFPPSSLPFSTHLFLPLSHSSLSPSRTPPTPHRTSSLLRYLLLSLGLPQPPTTPRTTPRSSRTTAITPPWQQLPPSSLSL